MGESRKLQAGLTLPSLYLCAGIVKRVGLPTLNLVCAVIHVVYNAIEYCCVRQSNFCENKIFDWHRIHRRIIFMCFFDIRQNLFIPKCRRDSDAKMSASTFLVCLCLTSAYAFSPLFHLPDGLIQDGPWGHQTISSNIDPSSLFI